jgi:class 3 adenylate cyclase
LALAASTVPTGASSPAAVAPEPAHTATATEVKRPTISAEGEHRLATLLYCQVSNAALLGKHLGAEGMLGFMDRFFQEAEAEIERFEGTISSFLNDGLVALFGAPVAHEDHARRAVLAALGIQRRLREASIPGAPPAAPATREQMLRMALHTGPVAIGQLGSGPTRRPTAVGDTVSLVTSLQQQAEPGAIVMSDATARLVTGYVRMEELEPITLSAPLGRAETFQVTGIGPRRSPIEGLGTRPLSRFVGREREMSALHDLVEQITAAPEMDAQPTLSHFIGRDEMLSALREPLARVEDGHGQVVGVVGEPGIGKSRLLYEFRRSLAGKHLTYLEGRCLSYARNVPYVPVLDLVRANCGIRDGDEPALIAEKIRSGLQEVGLEPNMYAPYVCTCWAWMTTRLLRRSALRQSSYGRSMRSGRGACAAASSARLSSRSRICTGSTDPPKSTSPPSSKASQARPFCCFARGGPDTDRPGSSIRM